MSDKMVLNETIATHIYNYYRGSGGFKAFCEKHNINYNSARKVYYYDGRRAGEYPETMKKIEEAILKDVEE